MLTDRIVNNAYDATQNRIELLYKDGSLRDIAEASDTLGMLVLARPVEKWYWRIRRCDTAAEWFDDGHSIAWNAVYADNAMHLMHQHSPGSQ